MTQWTAIKNNFSIIPQPIIPSFLLSVFLPFLSDLPRNMLSGDDVSSSAPPLPPKKNFSVLVQIEQKLTEDLMSMNPAGFMWHIREDFWEMVWSVYSSNPIPSNNQPPNPWHLVSRRGELLQRITGSTFCQLLSNSKKKFARGRGCTVLIWLSLCTSLWIHL